MARKAERDMEEEEEEEEVEGCLSIGGMNSPDTVCSDNLQGCL